MIQRNAAREPMLSAEEEQRLARRWRTSEDKAALARLVKAHLGLVVHLAGHFRNSGPALEDIIQEGHLGLTVAARRFDPGAGTRLATYATYWIRAFMMEHVVRSHGPVRIGTTRAQRKIFFGMGRARRRLERGGELATCEALAQSLGVETADVEAMAPRLSSSDVSMDAPRGGGDDRDMSGFFAEDRDNPEQLIAANEEDTKRKSALRQALKGLDPRERAIIKARHLTQTPCTLDDLGRRWKVSRERIRQIETRAVAKLQKLAVAC
jgi:RNA polymerase sigma-32 factor